MAACRPTDPTPTQTPDSSNDRVVLIQGVCSSSDLFERRNNWTTTVSNILTEQYGFRDLPEGDPDDQVILYGYSSEGWDQDYDSSDTLQSVRTSSAGLREIYETYPDSRFFVIGHSLGGIVSLDGMARYSNSENEMAERTGGMITVSSSVSGVDELRLGIGGLAIELVACRQVPDFSETSPVWEDIQESGDAISLIHGHDWSSVRVVNFANSKDRVVSEDTATLETHFEVACYDEGSDRPLQLNHDTLLSETALAEELLAVLLDGAEPKGCASQDG